MLFGKSIAEVQAHFGNGRSIERAGELLFMPRRAFQYYVQAFAEFVMSSAAEGDSDSASPFLNLLVARERRDPGSVAQVYAALRPTVEHVAANQEYYDADPNIYGSFSDKAKELAVLCDALHNRRA
ncbi:hypothetical protein AACH06_30055 [Ideonella sp. DXS29W]|uniref:Uncharacterized protein n=1 Tax=Ideonella lacteola TaxID=2984193 RepID=A0ABU9BYL3_9BURK